MKHKIARFVSCTTSLALPIIMWFTMNIIQWQIGNHPINNPKGTANLVAWSRLWAVQVAVCMFIGFLYPIQRPLNEKDIVRGWWGRSFILAILGGIIGSRLILPVVWWMAPLLTIFRLVQMSVIGIMLGTALREDDWATKPKEKAI